MSVKLSPVRDTVEFAVRAANPATCGQGAQVSARAKCLPRRFLRAAEASSTEQAREWGANHINALLDCARSSNRALATMRLFCDEKQVREYRSGKRYAPLHILKLLPRELALLLLGRILVDILASEKGEPLPPGLQELALTVAHELIRGAR